MQMGEMCLVMCGVWVCGSDGKWEFVVDKKKMARIVSVEEGISIKELERRVLGEFRAGELEYGVALSYWPPDSLELATWIKTSPVLLTNDGSLRYFFEHLKVRGSMNLFATVELLGVDGFDTPLIEKKQSGGGFREKGEKSRAEGIDSDYSGPEEIDERDVRPRGYDYEFWEPLLAGDLGGSNVVEVVFNDKEAEGLVKMEEARRPYSCYTNNAFDHMVDPEGSSEWDRADNKDEEPMDDLLWMGKTNLGGHETRGCETGGDVEDKEFDIPPLYDDTEYEAAEIPGLDVEEADGVVHVGKVYRSKVDCQISLAIYAIKNQIQFKQTRTKVDSFVCECPDTGCDWRVTAHAIRGTGYYEIRKAQLVHSFPIESRNRYRKRGTTRVIAAVYKAKFKERTKRLNVAELQRLVLEDLRISASYMKDLIRRPYQTGVEDAGVSGITGPIVLARYECVTRWWTLYHQAHICGYESCGQDVKNEGMRERL
uniref:Transposase MuDR plant domain-containing protein n=1 Tax=Brassica oleracea var. oleracea TaxID=109376 RepID=A0A0D3C7W0_BRAOL